MCCRLTNALGADHAHHFTRRDERVLVFQHDHFQQHRERLLVEALHHEQVLRRQVVEEHDLEQLGGRAIVHGFQALVGRLNHGKRFKRRDVHDGVVADLLQALDVVDGVGERHWQVHAVSILITKHAFDDFFALLNHEINPLLALGVIIGLLLLHSRNDALGECRGEHHVLRVAARHVVVRVNLVQAQVHQRHDLALHFHGVNAVLAVAELNDAALVVAHRHVVLNLQILHALDESALDISSGRGVAHLESIRQAKVERGGNGQIIHLGMQCRINEFNADNCIQNHVVENPLTLVRECDGFQNLVLILIIQFNLLCELLCI